MKRFSMWACSSCFSGSSAVMLRSFMALIRKSIGGRSVSLPTSVRFSSFSPLMNVLRFSDPGYEQKLEQLATHSSLFDSVITERTQAIIEQVRTRGDEALLELTARFDGARLRPDQLVVTTPEKFNASL